MRFIHRLLPAAVMATVAALATVDSSHASVVWTFVQDGNDVVATASGTFSFGGAQKAVSFPASHYAQGDPFKAGPGFLFSLDVASDAYVAQSFYPQGAFDNSITWGANPNPDTGTGVFGHIGANVLAPASFQNGSEINASLTWFNNTLDGVLGAGVAMPGSPVLLWQEYPQYWVDDRPQTISIVRAAAPETVPEPGTFALLGLGLAGLGAIRRRKAN